MKWKDKKMTKYYGYYRVVISKRDGKFYADVSELGVRIYKGEVFGVGSKEHAADAVAEWLGII